MTTQKQRAELLALAEDATARPWEMETAGWSSLCWHLRATSLPSWSVDVAQHLQSENARYIVAACNLSPALAQEVNKLEVENKGLRSRILDLEQRLRIENGATDLEPIKAENLVLQDQLAMAQGRAKYAEKLVNIFYGQLVHSGACPPRKCAWYQKFFCTRIKAECLTEYAAEQMAKL